MDEHGIVTRHIYDVAKGAVTQTIEDVDPQVSGMSYPSGWSPTSGAHLHLVTDFTLDAQGRVTQVLGPVHPTTRGTETRTATWTVYDDVNHEVRMAQGHVVSGSPTLVNPVSIQKFDHDGKMVESIVAKRGTTAEDAGALSAGNTFDRSSWIRWTTHQYNDRSQLIGTRFYHLIPTISENGGIGDKDTHYAETTFGYDAEGRQIRVVAPGGTTTRTIYDALGRLKETWVGTDDIPSNPSGLTWRDWPANTTGTYMEKVETREYYEWYADGRLSVIRRWVDGSGNHDRVTGFTYDWRGRTTKVTLFGDSTTFTTYTETTYDHLDRVTMAQQKRINASGPDTLLAQSKSFYDDQGRLFKTEASSVTGGTVGSYSLVSNTWYDASGRVIKHLPAGSKAFTKTQYDNLGRVVKSWLGYDTAETSYADAKTETSDTIFEQAEHAYDAVGNRLTVTTRRRLHTATGTGFLTNPAGSQPKARVSYVAFWYDGVNRQEVAADYGTYGGSTFSRPSSPPTQSSSTVLRAGTEYNIKGEAYRTTDPAGIATEQTFDAAGRRTLVVENVVPSGTNADQNRKTEFLYNSDGLVTELRAYDAASTYQATKYVYGTAISLGGGTPLVYRNDLLRAVIYPDSDDTYSLANGLQNGTDNTYDRVEYKYNRQGDVIEVKDQNQTVHTLEYDAVGRRTEDKVTFPTGSTLDQSVKRIQTAYDDLGRLVKVTSRSEVSGGSVVNDVELVYNGFGQVTADKQSHGGTVGSGTPMVQYSYANGSANHARLGLITYPNGRYVAIGYGSSGSHDDNLSRVQSLAGNSTSGVAEFSSGYSFLGAAQIVQSTLADHGLRMSLAHGTGNDPYHGPLDVFGRVADLRWDIDGTLVEKLVYGYNDAGSRLWKENAVAASQSPAQHYDEVYKYDALQQLKEFDRGDKTTSQISGATLKIAQEWTLDRLGNWSTLKEDPDGDGDWDLDQSRSHNKANEITAIAGSGTHVEYDAAGNMIQCPPLNSFTTHWDLKYDAWNRLVEVKAGSTVVATYAYDGLNRRVTKTVSGTVRHFYYSAAWQVLEERVGTATTADRQFVWGLRYIDDLILRNQYFTSSNEVQYAVQDGNFNVTALVDDATAPAVVERFVYTPYGVAEIRSANFAASISNSDWEHRYAGYRWDAETGLMQVRNRYLHAQLGRFVSRDPWENPYSYAAGRPISLVDPTGAVATVVTGTATATATATVTGGALTETGKLKVTYATGAAVVGAVIASVKTVTECVQGRQGQMKCCEDDKPEHPIYYGDDGKCCVYIELWCRRLESEGGWGQWFARSWLHGNHCYLVVRHTKDARPLASISGVQPDAGESGTQFEGTMTRDLVLFLDNKGGTKKPFDPGKDACKWLKCAINYARDLSGKYGYDALVDNSNTFHTRIIRQCGGTAPFPFKAIGSDDL